MKRRAVSEIPGIKEAYLYGSFAKGGHDAKSDVDVLLVGNPPTDQLESAIRKLERIFQREINYTLLSESELKKKLSATDPFIGDIWQGKRIKLLTA